jgi:hypothetical protein
MQIPRDLKVKWRTQGRIMSTLKLVLPGELSIRLKERSNECQSC